MYGSGLSCSFMESPSLFKSSDPDGVASGHSSNKGNTESQLDSVTELSNTNQRVGFRTGLSIPSDESSISVTLKFLCDSDKIGVDQEVKEYQTYQEQQVQILVKMMFLTKGREKTL